MNNNKSIYDINIKSVKGEDNFLQNFKGKVCLFTNVTGDCGNAPQFAVLETIYRKYKDYGFEIIAIPTSDFCGPGLTYGEHVYGTEDALEAESFAKEKYDVTYHFTELVESNPDPGDIIPGLPSKYGKVTPHELFLNLCYSEDSGVSTMTGNFMKYLVDKNGKVYNSYPNGALLHYNTLRYELGKESTPGAGPADLSYEKICEDIEKLLGI